MTTWEGGVRVLSMVRWPGVLEEGKVLNGIQGHQDMFTTLAAAAGIEDVAAEVMEEKQQYIDGVNNLAYWKGEQDHSNRNHIFHYYEGKLAAVRMGPWKFTSSPARITMATSSPIRCRACSTCAWTRSKATTRAMPTAILSRRCPGCSSR